MNLCRAMAERWDCSVVSNLKMMSAVEGISTGLSKDNKNEANGWVGSTAFETSNFKRVIRMSSFSEAYRHLC